MINRSKQCTRVHEYENTTPSLNWSNQAFMSLYQFLVQLIFIQESTFPFNCPPGVTQTSYPPPHPHPLNPGPLKKPPLPSQLNLSPSSSSLSVWTEPWRSESCICSSHSWGEKVIGLESLIRELESMFSFTNRQNKIVVTTYYFNPLCD